MIMTDLERAENMLRVLVQIANEDNDDRNKKLIFIADLIRNARSVYEIPQDMNADQTEQWFLTGNIN